MTQNLERPLRATKHCRHYSYEFGVGPKCARAVDLSAPGAAKVCMPDAKEAVCCDLREEYSDEERASWAKWRDDRAARMIIILAEIPGSSRDTKNKPCWGQGGEFDCPACKEGKVRWARARSNGHVAAACSTPHCFGVIE